VKQLGQVGLTKEEAGHWARVIIEKPFGHDLQSAAPTHEELKQVLNETRSTESTHYLGKRDRQNVMVFRFSNTIIEPFGIATTSTTCKITAAETLASSIGGGFYETAALCAQHGANHLFQSSP